MSNKKSKAKLDIVITHYNEPWEVGRPLFDSIRLQACCDFDEVNIMLIQDGEEDALDWATLLTPYPFDIRIVTLKKHAGIAGARNAGINRADSDWIMFMDFDDIFADACTLSQILGLFPVTEDVDIIWSKYVREVTGHGRFCGISLNCEDQPDFRMIGKIFRVGFLDEHNVRFMNDYQEHCDLIFNNIALAETHHFKFVNFSAPFYPFLKRYRKDGYFSTIQTLDKRVSSMFDRDLMIAERLTLNANHYHAGLWIARAVVDSYHHIVSSEREPDQRFGITEHLIDFWQEYRNVYGSMAPYDLEVINEHSQDEVMTYIQSYYNEFGKEYYLQNDMMTLDDFIRELDLCVDERESGKTDNHADQEAEPIVTTGPIRIVDRVPEVHTSHQDDKVVVYCGTKEVYVNMVASVKSLLATTPVDKVFFLIEDDVFPYELPPIVETVNVKDNGLFHPDGPNYANVWTYMCLMRTAFPQMFPQYDRVLSLDIDVVIMEDVSDLWDIDLTDYYFAGVEEQGHTNQNEHEFYANFGVIMMNLKKLREDGIGDKLIEAVNTEHFVCPEQDAFSKYCKGHMYKLPNDYNVTVYSHITGEPMRDRILHYAGLKYWKHFGPVKKYFNLSWDEIGKLQERARHE